MPSVLSSVKYVLSTGRMERKIHIRRSSSEDTDLCNLPSSLRKASPEPSYSLRSRMQAYILHQRSSVSVILCLLLKYKKTQFVSGLRVTDAESVGIAEMALVGKINTDLVARLNVLGGRAVGLNGKDAGLIRAKKHLADVYENGEVNLVDIGYVGNVEKINTELLEVLLDNDFSRDRHGKRR